MTEQDFHDLRWRVDLIPLGESIFNQYPELKERFIESEEMILQSITNDQLFRYVIYCYHKPSPFVRKINEPKHRKNQALIQTGFDFKGGVPEDIKRLVNNEDEKVGQIILRFLQFENNPKYAALMMQTDAYYKLNYQLAYTDVKQIKSLNGAIKDLSESIESLSHDVYSGDIEMNNFAASSSLKGLILSPEDNAHANKVQRL